MLQRRSVPRVMHTHPGIGLWHAMTFVLTTDDRILPNFDYEARPMFGDTPADPAQARADLARAPRPARWTPPWLATA